MALAYEKECIEYGVARIFDDLVHYLKVVKIKNYFWILQANRQTPQKWLIFIFLKHALLGHPNIIVSLLNTD